MCRVALAAVLAAFVSASAVRADAFDRYADADLRQAPKAKGVEKLDKVTASQLIEHAGTLPGRAAAFLIVRTNEGRFSKLLVQPARQKVHSGGTVPILLVERFVTFREGQERSIQAQLKTVRLFDGFQFSLDLGSVVPAAVGGDLRVVAQGGKVAVEPVGKAELYLVTRPLPEKAPPKASGFKPGEPFSPRFFAGNYKLHDDGRRSGTLRLEVDDKGEVSGFFYSDKDGKKYDVEGKVGKPAHRIRFRITFPQTVADYDGHLFTGDGAAMAGTGRMQERETGFYALRVEN
jgi:hypothetical protein